MNDSEVTASLELDAGSPGRPVKGLVAILDALGAKQFSDAELAHFLESRDVILNRLSGQLDPARLGVFTFNDTVIIVFIADVSNAVSRRDVVKLCIRLRKFLMHSLENGILFRGALSEGWLHRVHPKTNVVMGPAVSDAAAWAEQADWMGIFATPHSSIFLRSLLSHDPHSELLVDYNVPLKGRAPMKLKAINWPKGFWGKGLRPNGSGDERSMLSSFLAKHQVPMGTEAKYFNTIEFFETVVRDQGLLSRKR